MFKRVGGSPPSVQTPRSPPSTASTPKQTTTTTAASQTKAPPPMSDLEARLAALRAGGGHKPSASEVTAMKPPPMPGGTDVSNDFKKNPQGFAMQNMLNVNNTSPPANVALPTPGRPFVPASQSVVTVHAHQHNPMSANQGNANLTYGPAGGAGAQAHYLHYLSADTGRFAGINGVPQHPTTGPSTIVTGQLNGCAVHAFHDKNTGTMSFLHHADYSKNGKQELADFQKQHPNLQHAATVGPEQYSHPTGKTRQDGTSLDSGATLVANYDKPSKQWVMTTQLNEQKPNTSQEGRPDLMRPEFPGLEKRPANTQMTFIPPPQ